MGIATALYGKVFLEAGPAEAPPLEKSIASTVYLFGVGLMAVCCIVTSRSDWVTCAVMLFPLAVYLASFVADDPAPAFAALLCAVLFPVVEATVVRYGGTPGCVPTWSYAEAPGRFMPLGIPVWLIALWACAGAFIVALHDAIAACLATIGLPSSSVDAIASPFSIVAASVVFFGLLLAAMGLVACAEPSTTFVALLFITAATVSLVALTFGVAPVAPAVVTAALVAVAFPLLESVCIRTTGAWRYDDLDALIPVLRVPPYLSPLWASVSVSISFAALAARSLYRSANPI